MEDSIYFTLNGYTSEEINIVNKKFIWDDLFIELTKRVSFLLFWTSIDKNVFLAHKLTLKCLVSKKLVSVVTNSKRQVISVTLSVRDIKKLIKKSHHKITCAVFYDNDIKSRNYYLGRPQEISTNETISRRIYTWVSLRDSSFNDIHTHHIIEGDQDWVEYINDVKEIKVNGNRNLVAILSHRKQRNTHFRRDDDSIANKHYVLPVFLKTTGPLIIKFYNFKFNPPRVIDFELSRKELYDGVSCKRIREHNIVVTMYYKKEGDKFHVFSLVVIVDNYIESLNFNKKIKNKTL